MAKICKKHLVQFAITNRLEYSFSNHYNHYHHYHHYYQHNHYYYLYYHQYYHHHYQDYHCYHNIISIIVINIASQLLSSLLPLSLVTITITIIIIIIIWSVFSNEYHLKYPFQRNEVAFANLKFSTLKNLKSSDAK